MATRRAHFGNVRKLPSGRWQGSYWHAGARHTADRTFPAKADALAWLAAVEADIHRAGWVDPNLGRVTFGDYATGWLDDRSDLRPTTRAKYASLLRLHLEPTFGYGSACQGERRHCPRLVPRPLPAPPDHRR